MDITMISLNMIAMFAAMYGSYLFVKNQFELGAKVFLVGNTINVAVGLGVGDMGIVATQTALAWFTLPMYSCKRFSVALTALACGLMLMLGITTKLHISLTLISALGTVFAVYGAYRMSKKDFTTMAWMWIVADILFIWVAWENKLPGLFIQSVVFVYHGALRVIGKQLTDLIHFE